MQYEKKLKNEPENCNFVSFNCIFFSIKSLTQFSQKKQIMQTIIKTKLKNKVTKQDRKGTLSYNKEGKV